MEALMSWNSMATLVGLLMLLSNLFLDCRTTRVLCVIGYVTVIISLGLSMMWHSYPEPAVNTYHVGGGW